MEGRRRVARALRRKGVEVRSSGGLLVMQYEWVAWDWSGGMVCDFGELERR